MMDTMFNIHKLPRALKALVPKDTRRPLSMDAVSCIHNPQKRYMELDIDVKSRSIIYI